MLYTAPPGAARFPGLFGDFYDMHFFVSLVLTARGSSDYIVVASLGAMQGFGIAAACLGALGSSPALLCALTADPR